MQTNASVHCQKYPNKPNQRQEITVLLRLCSSCSQPVQQMKDKPETQGCSQSNRFSALCCQTVSPRRCATYLANSNMVEHIITEAKISCEGLEFSGILPIVFKALEHCHIFTHPGLFTCIYKAYSKNPLKQSLLHLNADRATQATSHAGALKCPGVPHLCILVRSVAVGTQAALDPRDVTLHVVWHY